jgi:hypothetical protein
VKGDGQLHGSQAWSKVPAGPGDNRDDLLSYFPCEGLQLVRPEALEVLRPGDPL